MCHPQYIKAKGGRKMVILPRKNDEPLREAAEDPEGLFYKDSINAKNTRY